MRTCTEYEHGSTSIAYSGTVCMPVYVLRCILLAHLVSFFIVCGDNPVDGGTYGNEILTFPGRPSPCDRHVVIALLLTARRYPLATQDIHYTRTRLPKQQKSLRYTPSYPTGVWCVHATGPTAVPGTVGGGNHPLSSVLAPSSTHPQGVPDG